LWAKGVPGGQIHQRMSPQYGDNALSRRVVYEWIEMFKNGRTSVTDAERSGHPTTATTAQNEELGKNRRVMVDEIAKLNISIGSAYSVVHDNRQFHKSLQPRTPYSSLHCNNYLYIFVIPRVSTEAKASTYF
jgi:hypothetical protein